MRSRDLWVNWAGSVLVVLLIVVFTLLSVESLKYKPPTPTQKTP